MKLIDYLAESGTTQAELAREIGATPAAVCYWVAGTKTPSLRRAAAIDKWSGGKVTFRDWLE